MRVSHDMYGDYKQCFQCGNTIELNSPTRRRLFLTMRVHPDEASSASTVGDTAGGPTPFEHRSLARIPIAASCGWTPLAGLSMGPHSQMPAPCAAPRAPGVSVSPLDRGPFRSAAPVPPELSGQATRSARLGGRSRDSSSSPDASLGPARSKVDCRSGRAGLDPPSRRPMGYLSPSIRRTVIRLEVRSTSSTTSASAGISRSRSPVLPTT